MACEKPGGADVGSTVDGSVLRVNMIDSTSSWVLFDYPLAESSLMDAITQIWVSVIATVTRHSVHLFIDGEVVDDLIFGFPTDAMGQCQDMSGMEPSCGALIGNRQEPVQSTCNEQISTFACTVAGVDCTLFSGSMAHPLKDLCESSCGGCANSADPRAGMTNNIAYPFPASLRMPLADLDLRSDIFIGARYDLDPARHFLGKMALLKVFSSPMNLAESSCLFFAGDIILAVIGESGGGHRRVMLAQAADEREETQSGRRALEVPQAA